MENRALRNTPEHPPENISKEPKILGFYQNASGLGEGTHPTPATTFHAWEQESEESCEVRGTGAQLTQRLSNAHRAPLTFPTPHHHITRNLSGSFFHPIRHVQLSQIHKGY